MMNLIYECTYKTELDAKRLMVGPGPLGVRVVSTVIGGWCKGERLSGTLSGAAGDWMLIGQDGFARLDVRGQLVTQDGAVARSCRLRPSAYGWLGDVVGKRGNNVAWGVRPPEEAA